MRTKPRADLPGKVWPKDWGAGARVTVQRLGEIILDDTTAALLKTIAQTRSISAAARILGISYRHAWMQVQRANENAGQQLVSTVTGGERGGGTDLTELGQAALEGFQRIQHDARSAATRSLTAMLQSPGMPKHVVHVAAAISLQEAVSQIISEYALVRPSVSVRTHYGASNELASLIEQCGACDLFISASRSHIDQLAKKNLIRKGTRKCVANNGLAVVATDNTTSKVRQIADLSKLKDSEIVVADPACPLGTCTKRQLQSAKVYEALKDRLVTVGNSRAVLATMKTGKSRTGIIFSSDIGNAAGLRTLLVLPPVDVKASYEAAIIAGSPQYDEARDLLRFLASDTAKACFRRCGFMIDKL